eukprot:PhM_4_TR3501/c0_g1_i1/m.39211
MSTRVSSVHSGESCSNNTSHNSNSMNSKHPGPPPFIGTGHPVVLDSEDTDTDATHNTHHRQQRLGSEVPPKDEHILARIWRWLYVGLLVPGDVFTQRVRKLFLAALVLPTVVAMTLSIVTLLLGNVMPGSLNVAFGLTLLCAYAWVRHTRTASDDFMISFISLLLLFAAALTITLPLVPGHAMFSFGAVLSIVTRVSPSLMFPLWMALATLNSYNCIAVAEGESSLPLFAVRDVEYPLSVQVATQVMALFAFCLCFFVAWLQQREYQRLQRRSELVSSFSTEVARYLVKYDTKAARAVVSEYVLNRHRSDATLAMVMTQIIDNMEAYRPFLPQYLMYNYAEDNDEGGNNLPMLFRLFHGGDDPAEPSGIGNTTHRSESEISSETGLESIMTGDPVLKLEEAATEHVPSGRLTPQSPRDNRVSSQLFPLQAPATPEPPPSTSITPTNQPNKLSSTATLPRASIVRNVAACYVHVRTNSSDAVAAFIDRVQTLAEVTAGTVHACFGDRVELSWNTTHKVHSAEYRAITFLMRAAKGAKQSYTAAGAVHCGRARFFFSGCRQLVPLVIPFVADLASSTTSLRMDREGVLGSGGQPGANEHWMKELHVMYYRYSVALGLNVASEVCCQRAVTAKRTLVTQLFDAFIVSDKDVENVAWHSIIDSEVSPVVSPSSQQRAASTVLTEGVPQPCLVHELLTISSRRSGSTITLGNATGTAAPTPSTSLQYIQATNPMQHLLLTSSFGSNFSTDENGTTTPVPGAVVSSGAHASSPLAQAFGATETTAAELRTLDSVTRDAVRLCVQGSVHEAHHVLLSRAVTGNPSKACKFFSEKLALIIQQQQHRASNNNHNITLETSIRVGGGDVVPPQLETPASTPTAGSSVRSGSVVSRSLSNRRMPPASRFGVGNTFLTNETW